MKPNDFCAPLLHALGKQPLQRYALLKLDPLSLGQLVHTLMHTDTLSVSGRSSGRSGDRVTVLVNNLPLRATLNEQGRFTVAVPLAQLMTSSTPTLSAVVIATDAQGTPAAASDALVLPLTEMRKAWAHRGRASLQQGVSNLLAGVNHA